jgi:hypothetical protein
MDTDVAVPLPMISAAAPPATEMVPLARLIVVLVSTPPTEIPGLVAYVTRQLAPFRVKPTLDTAPPNVKHEPEVITVAPDSDIVDDVNEMEALDMPRNAPVDGVNRDVVSAMIVAAATLPVAVMMFRPKTVAVVSCMLPSVDTIPSENASVVAMHDTVVLIRLIARLVAVPPKA